ncbi:GFA family protein [Novosphingobium sp. 1949]|uniref:GFA family protein n=1 Tax=Novosphingobium organovorum TaxID=2930092 RepID=A0ABT0B9M9_9SPHN|nr:GFA family protein [Novosphingobium organovorum]MCJ2181575.1 GFA family protein [Novosphingobium organovorum]
MHREGGCACGAIRFTTQVAPVGTGACHCTHCQKLAGGGPNYVALFAKGAVAVTKGLPGVYHDSGDSGGAVERAFCTTCGTPLWSVPEHAPFMTVKVGAFDEIGDLGPAMHIYTASAPGWHPIPDDRPTFEQMPPREAAPI